MSNESHQDAARQFVLHELTRPGRSRAKLARDAKVDPKTLRAFLDGTRWPQQDSRARLSVALGWEPDEIDHIESTGEHRGSVTYVSRETGERFDKPVVIHVRDWQLTRLYTQAISFAVHVGETYPSLADRADRLVDSMTDLAEDARRLRTSTEGGEGNASRPDSTSHAPAAGPAYEPATQDDYGLAAYDDEPTIEQEQDEPDTP